MKNKFSYIFNISLWLILGLSSCDSNKFDVDISADKVDLAWLHLETDITGLATKPDFHSYNDSLVDVYGGFYRLYAGRVMNFGDVYSPTYENEIMRFLMHKDIHQLFMLVDSNFHEVQPIQNEMSKAFSYYHHYFPEKQIPVIVSMVTGISNNIVVTDSVLGVGLDMYMGDSSKIYKLAGIPEYIRKKATRAYMPYDMMRGWVLSEFEPTVKKDDLLAKMISYGKSIYLMEAIFPFAEPHLLMGYTAEEEKWCTENEVNIWAKMIESEVLYSTDVRVLRSYTGQGPFSPGFPKESPAQIGYWVGWQIIRKYMDTHPKTTIQELMKMEDAQLILRKSKYKPR
tara:strand:- start:40329 stop:41351 length:1023 start_codon:yes stop_codon:yes gene_type:complete